MRRRLDVVRFWWLTPALGHEWRRYKGIQRLRPLSGGPWWDSNAKGGAWAYTPPPGLFRKFAQLKLSDDATREAGILAFANEYGDILAEPQEGRMTIADHAPWGEKAFKHAPIGTWYRAIHHMRRTVELWDQINDPHRCGELNQFINRNKGAITYKRVEDTLENGKRKRRTENILIAKGKDVAAYPAPDAVRPARLVLQLEIRRALADTETPSHTIPTLTPEMALLLSPTNLLAYMWLSFARVVSGEIEERPCEMFRRCGNHVYIARGLRRRDRHVTCSAKCRKRKSRDMK